MIKRYTLYTLLLLTASLTGANAQAIKIREKSSDNAIQKIDLLSYDGQSPYFDIQKLKEHPDYYNGAQILFLPNEEPHYQFMDGFRLLSPEVNPAVNDTVWNRSKTVIKKITPVSSDIYKPGKAVNEYVRFWNGDTGRGTGIVSQETGIFTERESIEGHVFEIIEAQVEEISNWLKTIHQFAVVLKDEEGKELTWTFSQSINGKDYRFMPVVMYEYIKQYEAYVGKQFVYSSIDNLFNRQKKEFEFEDELSCTELSFIAEKTIYDDSNIGYFYAPVLFFEKNGTEYHYNIIPRKNYGWLEGRSSITKHSFDALKEKEQYWTDKKLAMEEGRRKFVADSIAHAEQLAQARAEDERIAAQRKQEQKEQAARQKAAQEKQELERAQKLAERFARLKETYGEANANLMINGKVKIGWTAAMCRESWGAPSTINRTTTAYGVDEQWVYYRGYLYFTDGILKVIQD